MTQPFTTPGSPTRPGGSPPAPVGEQVKDAAGEVKDAAGQAVEQAQQTAGKVAEQAKQQATSQLTTQKARAAGGLGAVAQALRQTGQGLRDQDQDAVGRYTDTLAQQVERVAGYLRQRDVAELVEDVEDVARRQPGLFLGGAVALGFLGSRFLMSSGRRAARRPQAPPPAPGAALGAFRARPEPDQASGAAPATARTAGQRPLPGAAPGTPPPAAPGPAGRGPAGPGADPTRSEAG